jgi:hypothetical protein
MIIYKASNKSSGKIYIGLTSQALHKRLKEHLSASKPMPFQIALKRDGIVGFDFEIIDHACTRPDSSSPSAHQSTW